MSDVNDFDTSSVPDGKFSSCLAHSREFRAERELKSNTYSVELGGIQQSPAGTRSIWSELSILSYSDFIFACVRRLGSRTTQLSWNTNICIGSSGSSSRNSLIIIRISSISCVVGVGVLARGKVGIWTYVWNGSPSMNSKNHHQVKWPGAVSHNVNKTCTGSYPVCSTTMQENAPLLKKQCCIQMIFLFVC